MAYFRGTVQGGRGQASRLGHKSTGITASVRSWQHTIEVTLSYDTKDGRDYAHIAIDRKWLVDMPLDELAKGRDAMLEHMAHAALRDRASE